MKCVCILVNYNSPSMTIDCLRALKKSIAPLSIVVVDNGSTLHNVEVLRKQWRSLSPDVAVLVGQELPPAPLPEKILLLLPQNVGFSAGNNAALRLLMANSACSYFWLLNNDTLPAPDALEKMLKRMTGVANAGICGSTLVYAHTPEYIQTAAGAELSPLTGKTTFLHGGRLFADLGSLDLAKTERKMSFIVGASVLIRRSVLERIGLLPEEFFLYYEDTAFSLSARKAGFKLVWAKDSIVVHKEGASTKATGGGGNRATARPLLMDYLTIRNRFYLLRRYYPWALPIALCSLLAVLTKRIARKQAKRIPCLISAVWAGLCGKMGRPILSKTETPLSCIDKR